jgi:hypothetical protein
VVGPQLTQDEAFNGLAAAVVPESDQQSGGSARVRSPARERFTGPRNSLPSGPRFIEPVTAIVGGAA